MIEALVTTDDEFVVIVSFYYCYTMLLIVSNDALSYENKPCTNFHTDRRSPCEDKCIIYQGREDKNVVLLKYRLIPNWISTENCHVVSKCVIAHGTLPF